MMRTAKSVGRTIGVLYLLQMAVAPLVNFGLLDTMALWFVALAVVSFSGLVVEGIAVRSMLSLSQEYMKADPSDAGLFQAPATLIRSVRNSAHYMNLLVSGGSLLVLHTVMFRFTSWPSCWG